MYNLRNFQFSQPR